MSNRNSKLSVQNWTTDSITPSSSLSFSCWQHFVLHPSVCLAGPTLKISFLDALSPSWFCSQVFLITFLPFSLESVWHPGDTLMSTQAWSLWHKGSEKQSSSSPVQDTQHQHPTVPCSDASRNACPILLHASCPPPTIGFALDALLFPQTLKVFPWLAPLQESFPEHCTEYPFSWILCDPLSYFIISVP